MRNLRHAAFAAAILLACAAPARADNYTVVDGNGAKQSFGAKLISGVLYPIHMLYGLFNGSPVPVAVDAGGNVGVNCLSGCSGPAQFTPTGSATLAVTTSSARVALPSASGTALLQNVGASDLTFRLGDSTVAAATTDYYLPVGGKIVIATGTNTYVAGVTASGSSTLSITTGTGVPVIAGGGGSSGTSGTGLATAANQTAVQSSPGTDASAANAVQGITGGEPVAISINQSGAPGTNNGVVINDGASGTPLTFNDTDVPAVNLTAADTSTTSSTTNAQNGVAQITGTPTANSYLNIQLNGHSAVGFVLGGSPTSFTGQFETSVDCTTYSSASAKQLGASQSQAAVTGLGTFRVDVPGMKCVRLRLTALTGTLSVAAHATSAPGMTQVMNPVRVVDQNYLNLLQPTSSAAISISSATTTKLITAAAGLRTFVNSWDVIAAGTGTFQLVYGTGTNCGTGQVALTGVYNLTAGNGIVKGGGLGTVLPAIPVGNDICATTTTTAGMSGGLAWTQLQ